MQLQANFNFMEFSFPSTSILSITPQPGWNPVWWAVLQDCILPQSPPDGQRCPQPTRATQAHLCTPRDTETPVTCTHPWRHAGIPITSTCNTFLALLTSMERPPQDGLNDCYCRNPYLILIIIINNNNNPQTTPQKTLSLYIIAHGLFLGVRFPNECEAGIQRRENKLLFQNRTH